uniref:C2H2-type domain-containing protein n=1 Tax=Globodera pallida TaxID=36090 RepID=A0A183CJA3_GLOPA
MGAVTAPVVSAAAGMSENALVADLHQQQVAAAAQQQQLVASSQQQQQQHQESTASTDVVPASVQAVQQQQLPIPSLAWPIFYPVMNIPFFDIPTYQRVNLAALPSAMHNGLDLPMNDIDTLRFFFNVGVQKVRSITAGNTHPPTSSSGTLATSSAGVTNSTRIVPSTLQSAAVGGIPSAITSAEPSVKAEIKTEPVVAGQQQNGGGRGKKFKTLSKVQCAECDEFLPDTDGSRLHHTNVKHLNLCLYMCPVCNKEFIFIYNGLRICIQHIKKHHPKALRSSKAHVSSADFPEKMATIRARAVELFSL